MRKALLLAWIPALALVACSRPEPAPEPVRAVRTLTITPQSAGASVDYAGEVRARSESRLSFRVAGKMLTRAVDLGDVVKPGQVLAQLDPQDLRLGADAARATLAMAQAGFDQNAAEFKRYQNLHAQGFIGPAELDRRDLALKTARAQLDQAKAQASVQGNQADYAVLRADAGGVVTGIEIEPGMVVGAGTPVLRLAHDGPRDVVFAVPEDRIALLRALAAQPGRFTVTLWGGSAAPLPATIREISAAADPTTRTFLVKADIGKAAAAGGAQLGQTATVTMTLPQVAGIARLPLSALREEQGRSAVWVVDRNTMTVSLQPVQWTGADGNEAVVSSGLQPGQIVVTAGVHVLTPGQKVKFYVDPRPPSAPATAPASASASAQAPASAAFK